MAPVEVADQRVVSPTLVGRATELDLIARTVAQPPAVVVVDGEVGIGKTRLVNELLARPEVAGRRLLVGRCQRIRESFPLGAVIEAVRGPGGAFAEVDWSPVAFTEVRVGFQRQTGPTAPGRRPYRCCCSTMTSMWT